ncbi:hypothetical protein RB195_019758 [Necator americanus]|uniref:Uncharacterized protein n=1 Tax=Necator americanus TaxID=51031 RepID=A0ABR1CFN2_NECAM
MDRRKDTSLTEATTIPLHKKLPGTEPKTYREISLLRVMCYILDRITLYRLVKYCEEVTRDKQADLWPGLSTIDQQFIVRRGIGVWQQYLKLAQLTLLT